MNPQRGPLQARRRPVTPLVRGAVERGFLMSAEGWFVYLAVGALAGWFAARVAPGRSSMFADVLTGLAGGPLAGMTFRALRLQGPCRGVLGTAGVGLIGAGFLLLVSRAVRGERR